MAKIARLLETLLRLIFSCFEKVGQGERSGIAFLFGGDCKFCCGKCNKEAALNKKSGCAERQNFHWVKTNPNFMHISPERCNVNAYSWF